MHNEGQVQHDTARRCGTIGIPATTMQSSRGQRVVETTSMKSYVDNVTFPAEVLLRWKTDASSVREI